MNAYMAPYVSMSPRATSLEYDVETIEKWLDTVELLLNEILCILFLFLLLCCCSDLGVVFLFSVDLVVSWSSIVVVFP